MDDDLEHAHKMLVSELAAAGLALDHSGLWSDADQNVGVLAHQGHAVVGWIEIRWRSSCPPADFVLTDAVHLPAPIEADPLRTTIERARAAGAARRQTCRYCAQSFNPGWMHEAGVCQGCAEEHLGVDH
ncbi:hypothetical protein GKE82_11475 [Conexibacter sp. W3-3-2]|uniref:hypothetical protein n=1 Tax=Conexibacter sp. W3-3-2 TaxID=2675227 RepID=UPI0012B7F80A|nr:hypothetical protein [Conexibacter sp. W3-3-2]MTD44895.1 hypothetical protein [Conexibacter sp. W3-3-2]